MTALRAWVRAVLRGSRVSAILARFDIDARRFWLLTDLFDQLSQHGEMMDQLGRDGVSLRFVSWLYTAITAILALVLVSTGAPAVAFFTVFLSFTVLILASVLLSEAGNSLVNATESLVLAHQPINGATYIGAKLTHLGWIVSYMVPALNGVPAIAGLFLPEARWYYPLLHLGLAYSAGLATALLCCAVYGWLLRFVPARRLKAAAQLIGAVPFLAMSLIGPLQRHLGGFTVSLPESDAVRWGLAGVFAVTVVVAVVFGIRSLSADYLLQVSSILRGRRKRQARRPRELIGGLVARLFGGAPSQAGFAYVSKMGRRDAQFRRQAIPLLAVLLAMGVPAVTAEWRTDPFSREFAPVHFVPHATGILLMFICSLLGFGAHFQGAWVFQLIPARSLRGFANGVYAAMWVPAILIPHLLLAAALTWDWSIGHVLLFVAYSTAVASVYLALDLRLVTTIPFTAPVDPKRSAALLPFLALAGLATAGCVGLQYYYLFRTEWMVLVATILAATAAFLLGRSAVRALEAAMRFDLVQKANETGGLYREVET